MATWWHRALSKLYFCISQSDSDGGLLIDLIHPSFTQRHSRTGFTSGEISSEWMRRDSKNCESRDVAHIAVRAPLNDRFTWPPPNPTHFVSRRVEMLSRDPIAIGSVATAQSVFPTIPRRCNAAHVSGVNCRQSLLMIASTLWRMSILVIGFLNDLNEWNRHSPEVEIQFLISTIQKGWFQSYQHQTESGNRAVITEFE